MKVLLCADFRSPHAWRDCLRAAGIGVMAVSSEGVDDENVVVRSLSLSTIRKRYVQSGEQMSDTFVGVRESKLKTEAVQLYGELNREHPRVVGESGREEFTHSARSAEVIVSHSWTDGMQESIPDSVASGSRIDAGDLPQVKELADRGVDIDLIDGRECREIAAAIARQAMNDPQS
jgi:hypothetical protein